MFLDGEFILQAAKWVVKSFLRQEGDKRGWGGTAGRRWRLSAGPDWEYSLVLGGTAVLNI